jgi:aspartate-semialdehyde dehydrogenase
MAKPRWAVVGAETLLGKDLLEVIAERKLPVEACAYTSRPGAVLLTAAGDESELVTPLEAGSLAGAQAVFLAGGGAEALQLAQAVRPAPVIVDLTGAHEDVPKAQVCAPVVLPLRARPKGILVTAHPAAAALAQLCTLLHPRFPFRHAIVNVFEPASAQDQGGIDELHKQTISLLSFKSMPQEVFDAQVSFNLLPRFGEEAQASLARSAARIERHLASLLAPLGIPLPSLRLIYAPVFHGYVFSVWLEMEDRPACADVEAALRAEGIDLRTPEVEPPSNRGVAGQSGITVGEIAHDANHPRGLWLWMAADNLRLTADNAVLAAGLAAGGQA